VLTCQAVQNEMERSDISGGASGTREENIEVRETGLHEH
jgi:hypothetical protein